MYFPMYFDPTYVLVILGVIICLAASAKMRSTFNKYSRVRSRTGMTGTGGGGVCAQKRRDLRRPGGACGRQSDRSL